MTPRRAIPSIDRLLDRPALAAVIVRHGRQAVTDATRRAAEAWRASASAATDETPDRIGDWIEARAAADLDAQIAPSLRAVINATGVANPANWVARPSPPRRSPMSAISPPAIRTSNTTSTLAREAAGRFTASGCSAG